MGKTAFALNIAINTAIMKHPVVFFSLEMSNDELTTRLLSRVTDYSSIKIRNAEVNFEYLVEKSNEIAVLPLIIDDSPLLSLFDLKSKIKKIIVQNKAELVIVDYLQLMSAEADHREQEISKISRGLKALSKEFNIPVIALSQLNRSVEERSDKVPKLSDLRESGAIEQDADIVCFVSRPAVYKQRTIFVNDTTEISTENLMVFNIAKNRNGAIGELIFYHTKNMSKIQEEEFQVQNEPIEKAPY
jgi:replicative DNA helicase